MPSADVSDIQQQRSRENQVLQPHITSLDTIQLMLPCRGHQRRSPEIAKAEVTVDIITNKAGGPALQSKAYGLGRGCSDHVRPHGFEITVFTLADS